MRIKKEDLCFCVAIVCLGSALCIAVSYGVPAFLAGTFPPLPYWYAFPLFILSLMLLEIAKTEGAL